MVRSSVLTAAALSGLAMGLPNTPRTTTDDSWKSKIKNVVVLVEEEPAPSTPSSAVSPTVAISRVWSVASSCNPV